MTKEWLNNYNLIYICGAKGFGDSGPFDIKPKVHAEEEEVPEDEWRESRLPNCTAGDDPLLGRPKSWERKTLCHSKQSIRGSQKEIPSHMG